MPEESLMQSIPNTVLIIDEDATIVNALTLQLEDKDWNVFSMHGSDDAMTICQEQQVDVALICIGAASFDGMQLAQNLRSNDPDLIIVIMTGYPMVDRAVDILKYRATDYLMKPFRIEQLLMAIDRAQREQNLLRENQTLKRNIAELREDIARMSQTMNDPDPDSEMVSDEIPLRSTDYGAYPTQSKGTDPDAIASYERQMAPTSLGSSGDDESSDEPEIAEEKKEDHGPNEQST
ncbi:response regulator [Candidatus Neomarinimicrobiota bacterium]